VIALSIMGGFATDSVHRLPSARELQQPQSRSNLNNHGALSLFEHVKSHEGRRILASDAYNFSFNSNFESAADFYQE
jgi:hypothetical protein